MDIEEAIEVLKELRYCKGWNRRIWIDEEVYEAIDTVVDHCEKPTCTKDRIIEILVTTKALTEHLSQDERNEFFEKAIKYWEATE